MTNKLSIIAANKRLLAETETARVKAVKLALSSRKAGEVSPPRFSDKPTLTKITQITVDTKDVRKEPSSTGQSFPTAKRADQIVKGTPTLKMKSAGDGGAPSKPSIKGRGIRPNQNAENGIKTVGKGVNVKASADDGSSSKSFIPARSKRFIDDEAYAKKAGNFSTNNNTPTIGKQKPINLHGTTSPKMSQAPAGKDMPSKSVGQIKHQGGFVNDPSDGGPRSVKVAKPIRSAENLVESGVNVLLNGKVKAHFEIVSHAVLNKMVESYSRHGLKVDVVRGEAAWMKDKGLLKTLWESLDAQYNGVNSEYERMRLDARNRFKTLVQGSYNNLYEDRQTFLKLIDEAFKKVEDNARQRYVEGLQLMTCKVRVLTESGTGDMELVTEAHTDQMALRQVRNKMMEMYGLGVRIDHIFVDGAKYNLADIEPWVSVISEK